MSIKLSYIFSSTRQKREELLSLAMRDPYFEPIVHDFIDYGHEISFSIFGGAGAYQPYALTTDPLDTPEKQQQFYGSLQTMFDAGKFKAQIKLSLWLGQGGNIHSFLHELMHFYQDMLGLYLLPLKERGVMPIMADLRTSVIAILFCEAWAQIESLRACWSFKHKNIDDAPWQGALDSPDWGELARFYYARMEENRGEAWAAAKVFEQWYKTKHRDYYEQHALSIYDLELDRLIKDLNLEQALNNKKDIKESSQNSDKNSGEEDDNAPKNACVVTSNLRGSDLSSLILKIPKDALPSYFEEINWEDELFNEPRSELVLHRCAETKNCYWSTQNKNINEVRCASPPYLWKRLRMAEIASSQVPPQSTMQFEHKE